MAAVEEAFARDQSGFVLAVDGPAVVDPVTDTFSLASVLSVPGETLIM
jgi:hypothetical protein